MMPSRALRRAAPPSDPLSPVPQRGKQPPGRPWTTSAEYPLMSLQWEGTIFLLEATGGCGNWGSRFGSASQVAIASSFSDPLRICISDSDECCGGPWSFSPDSELTPQPCCLLHDLRVRPSIMHQHCKCSLEKNRIYSLCLPGVILNHKATLIPMKPVSVAVLAPQEIWTPGDGNRWLLGWVTQALRVDRIAPSLKAVCSSRWKAVVWSDVHHLSAAKMRNQPLRGPVWYPLGLLSSLRITW